MLEAHPGGRHGVNGHSLGEAQSIGIRGDLIGVLRFSFFVVLKGVALNAIVGKFGALLAKQVINPAQAQLGVLVLGRKNKAAATSNTIQVKFYGIGLPCE